MTPDTGFARLVILPSQSAAGTDADFWRILAETARATPALMPDILIFCPCCGLRTPGDLTSPETRHDGATARRRAIDALALGYREIVTVGPPEFRRAVRAELRRARAMNALAAFMSERTRFPRLRGATRPAGLAAWIARTGARPS